MSSVYIAPTAAVSDSARVMGSAMVTGSAVVTGSAWVMGSAVVKGSARVEGSAWVEGEAWVTDSAVVTGSARVTGSAIVGLNARISRTQHYITIDPIGREHATLTAWRDLNGIGINRGCFTGLIDEFERRVSETHGDNQHGREYAAAIALIRARAESWEPITDEERGDMREAEK